MDLNTDLVYCLMADREEVVAKLFVIPHHHSAITASQKGVNLQDIKDEVGLSVCVFVYLLSECGGQTIWESVICIN